MLIKGKVVFFAFLTLIHAGGLAAEFIVPMSDKVPVIDGTIEAEEWKYAMTLSGAGNPVDARKTQLFVTWDEENVYLAIRSETPPRGKLVKAKNTRNIVLDDSVEFWFDPPKTARELESAKFGEFQLIASHTGEIYVQHHNPGYGLPARKWVVEGIRVQNGIRGDVWDCEIAIPAKAFGFTRLSEMDWRILPVRNFRTFPGGQLTFVSAGSFTDSQSYPLWKFRKNVPSVHQTYGEESRLPLVFSASEEGLMLEEVVNGEKRESLLPVTLTVPEKLPALVSVTVRRGAETLFQRDFHLKEQPDRIWTTPESYLVLEQDFENGLESFLSGGENIRIKAETGLPEETMGRKKGSKAAFFSDGCSIVFAGSRIPLPGNVSMWVKTESRPKGKTYRRYFASLFKQTSGYLGLQEQGTGQMLFFLHGFSGEVQNVASSRYPVPGSWTHLSVNLYPNRVEYYCNGLKCFERDLNFELKEKDLGSFVLGGGIGGFALDEYSVYGRALKPEEILDMAQGESKVTGKLSWYPSLNAITADLTVKTETLKAGALFLKVSRRDGTGKALFLQEISLKNGIASGDALLIFHEKFSLDRELEPGFYRMALSLCPPNSEEILLEKIFEVRKYPWMNNNLGKNDRILPGFTPLCIQDQTISCVLRDYRIGASGLPESIVSMDREILAGPVTVNKVQSGKVVPYEGKNAVRIERVSDTTAVYAAESEGLKVQGRLEQDGLLRLDLTFTEIPDAERIYVDIPVKKEFAELYHAVGDHIRTNPAGFVPRGEGTVFKSRSLQQVQISNFIPYLWLGTDTRGVCYAADWDKGWIHAKDRDAVELFRRENGDVSIHLNLINGAIPKKDHEITIALMASPVKPMPEGWRGWSDGFGYPGTKVARCLYSPPYWGGFCAWVMRYPAFGDFEYVRKLAEAKKTGKIDFEYQKNWIERCLNGSPADIPWITSKTTLQQARAYVAGHTNAAFQTAKFLHNAKNGVLYFYTCDSDNGGGLPEFSVMEGEWGTKTCVSVKSYQDYAIYYLDKMLEAGMDGIYDDNTFFSPDYSWATGNGYIDEKGEVHPSLGLWENREYRRRQINVMLDHGLNPWITVHQTNANILPSLGFGTNSMGMEWKYGSHDFQERFSPDYIRAVCQGLQGGFFPTVLDGIAGVKNPEEKTWATRTMLACLLPHEVRPTCPSGSDFSLINSVYTLLFHFGIGEKDCVYTAYWDSENPVKSDDPDLLASTYVFGKKMLIVCGSYADEDRDVNLTSRLLVRTAKNVETSNPLMISDGKIVFPLKKHDFILIEAELE